MIDIIEKEPYKDYDGWDNRECLMYPVMMIKNNIEYFIFNRREPEENYRNQENERMIRQLKENNGMYVTFYSPYQQSTKFLKNIIENEYSFDKRCTEFREIKEGKFVDFHGNLNEISSAFMYRIYDTKLIKDIKQIVELIDNKEWEKAREQVRIKEKEYEEIYSKENEEIEQ